MQAILAARERDGGAKLSAIYPILVGRQCSPEETHYPCCNNFFTDGSADGLRKLPDKVAASVLNVTGWIYIYVYVLYIYIYI